MKRPIDRNAILMRARQFRRSPTLPEGLLWQHLKGRPGGFKFRRQHPFGWYIADFYCPAARLVVEVDGACHEMGDGPADDARRDAWLRRQGLAVVRFAAADVLDNIESVLGEILRVARVRLPLHQAPPGPPPQDGGLGRN